MGRGRSQAGRPHGALVALVAFVMIAAGAGKKRKETPPKIEETINDLAYIVSSGEAKLEGVGLVVGLDGTGGDPPPSWYRTKLVDDMRKAGVEDPNAWLADKHVSMVLVKMAMPTGVSTKDRLDIEVSVPPGCGTTSLAGGILLATPLQEVLVAKDGAHEGKAIAVANGPILVGTAAKPTDAKVGRVLGGGRPKKDVPYNLILKDTRRGVRTSLIVETAINRRFHQRQGVDQKGLSTAKTDEYLVLAVPTTYHHNQKRFFQVVLSIPVVDTPELLDLRRQKWGKELLDPQRAGIAAIKLEALGSTALDQLKAGLKSENAQVRFFAAESLAYLGDDSGAAILGETAANNADFRVFAFAALSSLDQPAAHMALRKLMDVADVKVRYGAFDALRTLDPSDPFLGRVRVLEEPADPHADESTALSLRSVMRQRAARTEDPFLLYLVDSEGPPLVHVASSRRAEIVVFGRGTKLLTPIVLGTGPILLNAANHDDTIQMSRIVPSAYENVDEKTHSSLEVGDMIRRVANLGAKYPEIVDLLLSASKQHNLAGPLVFDALPPSSPKYLLAQVMGKDTTKKDDALNKAKYEEKGSRTGRFFNSLFGRRKADPKPEAKPDDKSEAKSNDQASGKVDGAADKP
ncbi:MAG: flagellar basal body P-ring protein FlgI [Planctomycetota bacterium]|nr:flagellar basal body P-ring protein FlgI [Planctomycetota bacterium]